MTASHFLVMIGLSLVVGIWIGAKLEERKWRRNADDGLQIESGGRLYKVDHE